MYALVEIVLFSIRLIIPDIFFFLNVCLMWPMELVYVLVFEMCTH